MRSKTLQVSFTSSPSRRWESETTCGVCSLTEILSHWLSCSLSSGLSGQLGRPEESVGSSVWKGDVQGLEFASFLSTMSFLYERCFGLFCFTLSANLIWFHPVCVFWVQVDFADTSIIITEPYFNFTSIQESMNEILFEEYQFQSALRINGET